MTEPAPFTHRQAAHCESGVVSALSTHAGAPISEPMAFGLSASLAFAVIPIVKLHGMPLIAYRMPPGSVIRGVRRGAGLRMTRATFKDPERGMAALDAAIGEGRIVGLQCSVYWLPYFPDDMRFHFNAHNLIVYGREGNEYLISDPVFDEATRCDRASLMKARFAKGLLAARGVMYYAERAPEGPDLRDAIPRAIRRNRRLMTMAPVPFVGLRGIRGLAKRLRRLAAKGSDPTYLRRLLAHIVRMQEEIGTGGAGFRFMYAAYLREAAGLLDSAILREASSAMTDAGDTWRLFALRAARMCKGREPLDPSLLADVVMQCADKEGAAWRRLRDV